MFNRNNFNKIIITGSNGYLGLSLVKYFSKFKNFKILCIHKSKIKSKVKRKNVNYIKHNLLFKIPDVKIKSKYDVLLHFAGPKNDRSSVSRNKKKILEGIKIDKNIIDFSIKKKIKLFVYASSAAVYSLKEGENSFNNSFKEENVKKNTSYDGVYGYTKKYTENYLQQISNKKLNYIICRIFSIYGKNTKTIINLWKKKVIKKKTISIWGSEKIVRSWLHIDDFLSAIKTIIKKKNSFKKINIGSNEIISLEDIIEIIKKKYKKEIKIKYNKKKYPGPLIRFANQQKMRKLGWKQKIYLSKGLELI